MPTTLIRPCIHADVDAIFALDAEWEREDVSYQFIAVTRQDFIATLEAFPQYHYVAEHDNQVIGYISGTVKQGEKPAIIPAAEPYLEIENIYVLPDFRDSHIGSLLIEKLLAVAEQNGIHRFFVSTVTRDMDRILKFYKSYGFKPWYVELFK